MPGARRRAAALRRRALPAGTLLALALLLAAAPQAADEACVRVGEGSARFPPPAPGDTLQLPHRLITASSLRVRDAQATYREGIDFHLDALEGRLIWQAARPDTTALFATYRHVPWALRGRWGAASAALAETLLLRAPASASFEPLPPGANLAIGGSKTFGLEFGNRRDANLTQSLDLTVRGQLAPEVKVRAVLTDRTTPLQPEGTTAELQDLDQVLVELTAPWGEMRLGDVEVQDRSFRFLAHQRAMEGLRVRVGRVGGTRGSGALGRGAGRHFERQFLGVEGKQGPYRLLDRLPGEDAVVVAGTERIWLDGVALERGAASDYTIDYGAGEVWFTARRGIRAVSEIRIECQIREGVFDRSYYTLGGTAGDSARAVAVAWLRESDDPGRTLTVALTEAERESLRLAGDEADAIAGGARVDSVGDYALVETDSTSVPFYLYVAESSDPDAYGTRYAVVFSDVGEGEGDYASSSSPLGRTYYRYVGPDRGRYVPGRRLVLPEARDLLAARARGRIGDGFSVSTEAAVSRHDRNLLSDLGDGDNVGGALALDGAWRLGRAQALELTWRGRVVEKNFSAAEAIDPAFDYRRWNASADSVLDGRDRRGALGLAWRPRANVRGAIEWEGLRSVHEFEGSRWHLAAERTGALRARGELWRTRTTEQNVPGEAERQRWAVGLAGRTEVEATYESETRYRGRGAGEGGERFAATGWRLGSRRWFPGLDAEFRGEFRRDWEREAGASRRKDDRALYQTNLSYAGGGALARLLYARHTTRDAASGRTGSRDLADWSIARQDPDARVTGEWRGSLTIEEKRLRIENLQRVGAGLGHYDSLGRRVGEGDFELYYQDADSSDLETRFESALRGSARPFAGSSPSALAGLEAIVFGRVAATTPEPPGWLLGATRRWFSGEGALRRHQRLLRGEIAWVGEARAPAPRLRVEGSRGVERSVSGLARETATQERMLEVRWSPREAIRTRADYTLEGEREGVGGAEPDRHRVWISGLEATWSPLRRLRLRARGEGGREHYDPAGRRRSIGALSAGFDLEPYPASRLEVGWERRWASGDPIPAGPFLVEKPGWDVTANASAQPRAGLSVTLRVSVARERGEDAIVSGRMDARAYF